MSKAPAQRPIVTRDYRNSPDECTRALALLLTKPINEGGPPTAPDDAMKGSKHDRATKKYTRSP